MVVVVVSSVNMSSSPESASVGPESPSAAPTGADTTLNSRGSESDLSEVNETRALPARNSPSPSPTPTGHESSEDAEAELDVNGPGESSGDEAQASDDADYDMEESAAASQSDENRDDRSTSRESRRAPKRKAVAEEDEYIRENPELYGLRRSVCSLTLLKFFSANLNAQSRPTKQPRIVSYCHYNLQACPSFPNLS